MPISSNNYTQQIYAIPETAYKTPTQNSTAIFTGIKAITPSRTFEEQPIRVWGNPYIHGNVIMSKTDTLTVGTYLYDLAMIKRSMTVGGVGTNSEPITLVEKYSIGGVPYFDLYLGCYVQSSTFDGNRLYMLNNTYSVGEIQYRRTAAQANAIIGASTTFPAPPAGLPKVSLDAATITPATFDGAAIDLESFSVTVAFATPNKTPLGNFDPANIEAINPEVTGTFTTWSEAPGIQDIFQKMKDRGQYDLVFKLWEVGTTDAVITIEKAVLNSFNNAKDMDTPDYLKEAYNFRATKVVFSTPAV